MLRVAVGENRLPWEPVRGCLFMARWGISFYELLSALKTVVNFSPLLCSFSLRRPVFLVYPRLALFFKVTFLCTEKPLGLWKP